MILKKVLDLSKSIHEYRQAMYELVKNKGTSDPSVVRISQQLDGKITLLQKYINEMRSISTESSGYQAYKYK